MVNISNMNIIPKHQSGGPVTVVYQPLERPLASLTMAAYAAGDSNANASSASGGGATSSSSSSKSDEGLLTKDLIKEAYTKGLPNDVAEFMSKVSGFGNDLFGMSNGLSSSNYKQLVSMLASLQLNKEQYTKALEHATSKNTLNEPAITSDGKVFVLGSDGLITKSVSEVGSDEKTLSVGELSQLRAYSKDMAFDNGILTTAIAGSISIQDVFKSIQDVVSKIGNSEVESEVIGRKSGRAVTQGLEVLLSEAEDGTYKIKKENKNQLAQAQVALQYILASLPVNQQALLQEYSRRHGMDTSQGPLVLIKSFIQGQLSDVSKLTIASAPDGSSGSGDGSGSGNKRTKMTFPMQLITGDGLAHSTEQISFGTGEAYSVDVQSSPQIPLTSGGVVKAGSADKILESELGGIIESDSIHVGDQLISPMALSRMYYDGTGVKAMWLPVKKDGNGKDMPNMDLMKRFIEVQQKIKNLSAPPTPQQVNAMLRTAGLQDYYSADGQVLSNYRRFAVISVLGDETTFKDPDESKAFTEVDDDGIRETFSRSLGTEKNPLKIEGDLYRTNLFIPLYDSPSLARQAGGNPGWISDNGWQAEEQAYSEVQAQKNFKQPQPKSAL